jgi:hypothetical protein
MYAVTARFPHNLSGQVPWQQRQAGVYDCHWGLDVVRVLVAGQLPREAHNAPLHLFSASPDLVGFGSTTYKRRSESTSSLLEQLFGKFQSEGLTMPYTMADFQRDYVKQHFAKLTPEELAALWRSLPAQKRAAIFETLPLSEQQAVMQELPPEIQEELLQSLPPERQAELLQSLPLETRLAIKQYLDGKTARRPSTHRKPRRKK